MAMSVLSAEHSIITLNGHKMVGMASEEAVIEYEVADVAEYMYSPDGGHVFGIANGRKGREVTFRTMPNSPTHKFLMRKFQRFLSGIYETFSGTHEYPNAFNISLREGFFKSGPFGQNVGTGFANGEFVLSFTQILADYDLADFATSGLLSRSN